MSLVARTLGIALCGMLLLFHGCAIYVSMSFPKIKQTKFLQLALLLSLSDFLFGVELIYLLLLKILNDGSSVYGFQCMLKTHLASGTIISSLVQTLIICLERLNATFATKVKILDYLTRNVSVGLCFGFIHCLAIIRFGVEMSRTINYPCSIEYTMSSILLFTHDIPTIMFIITIIICYGFVMKRIVNQSKIIASTSHPQNNQIQNTARRMRRNVITLGLIIAVAITSQLPRSLIGFYVFTFGGSPEVSRFMSIANSVFMTINPLVDPLIYILRIRQYRDQLRCKCCKQNTIEPLRTTNTVENVPTTNTVETAPTTNTVETAQTTHTVETAPTTNTEETVS